MESSRMGGGIIDLEHSIHLQHPAGQPVALAPDHPMPFSLFDPSPVKPRLASDDEDDQRDLSFGHDEMGQRGRKAGPSSSPWQRMKWTDDMVRLLVMVVASVGDDCPLESPDGPAGAKRKLGASALQKKGKWKTVSNLMLEKGCYVSPQQCEDKFNDLNKRYKKLNEILGRGTTCQVVENPSLLDSMSQVPPKAKEDVRKILASKHLFYREMCAYHHGQRIPNSSDDGSVSCGFGVVEVVTPLKTSICREEVEEEEEEVDNEEEDDVDNVSGEGGCFKNIDLGRSNSDTLRVEMDAVFREGKMPVAEMKEWFRKRTIKLEEERVEIEAEAFELEERRFKWQRFSRKKDREMERMRLENERMGLDNARMALEVKQKELELELEMKRNIVLGQHAEIVLDSDH